jgi:hypothetical protein
MSRRARLVHLTVRALQPLVGGLEVLGTHAPPLLRAAGMQPELLEDPDAVVPSRQVSAFWRGALDATGDDMLGFHLAEAAPMATFDVHAYAMLSSRTLREAYQRACRYQRLVHETTRLELQEGPEHGTLVHALPGGRPVDRHPAEFLVTAWVRIGRLVLDQRWVPEGVYFAHAAPDDLSEYARYFGAPVHFEAGRTALRVRRETLDQAGAESDERLATSSSSWAPRSRSPHRGRWSFRRSSRCGSTG